MTRCRRLADSTLTVDADAQPRKTETEASDEDDDALLPFGVDIGAAVATPLGFAVSGLRGGGSAFLALIGEHATRRIELGELHGDAEPPALALSDGRVVVALRSSDAAGFTLKLGAVTLPDATEVAWGSELSKLGKAVSGVELAASDRAGLLVYQTEDKDRGSRLMLGSFTPGDLRAAPKLSTLEEKDAEQPHLALRDGGFWLSFVRALPDAKRPTKPPADAGSSPEDPEERELLDSGSRVIEVLKLDAQGKPLGAARRIGEPRRQVLLYDIAPLASGALLLAVRSDSATPGAEGGALLLSQVSPDGSVQEERLDDDELGAGAPVLLSDADTKRSGPWLSMSGPNDTTRVGLAQGAHSVLHADPMLGHAEAIAVSAGHFLVQRARGRGVLLETLRCDFPAEATGDEKR